MTSVRLVSPPATLALRIGVLVWIVTATLTATHAVPLGIIESLLLFGPLVIVPIGLTMAAPGPAPAPTASPAAPARRSAIGSRATLSGPLAVVLAAALLPLAFAIAPGVVSTSLTLPWLATTSLLAVLAARRWWRRPSSAPSVARRSPRVGSVAAARSARGARAVAAISWVWLPAAALGITASRASRTVFSIPPELIELAGVHFTFAGFAASAIAARVLGATAATRDVHPGRDRAARVAALATVGGCATVGIGHATVRAIELVGSSAMTIGVVLVGVVAWIVSADPAVARTSRILLRASALSVLGSMGFALAYAWALTTGADHLPYETIALVHGSLNAFGFALCGLLGWRGLAMAPRRLAAPPPTSGPWPVTPLDIDRLESSVLDDPPRFPPGSISLDDALIVRDLACTVHGVDAASTRHPTAGGLGRGAHVAENGLERGRHVAENGLERGRHLPENGLGLGAGTSAQAGSTSSRVRSSRVSRRTTTRASPSSTNTTAGRVTLL